MNTTNKEKKKGINDKYLKSKEYLQKRVIELEKELLIIKYHLTWIIEVAQKGLVSLDLDRMPLTTSMGIGENNKNWERFRAFLFQNQGKQQPLTAEQIAEIDYILKNKDKIKAPEGFKKVIIDEELLKDKKDNIPASPPPPKSKNETDKKDTPTFSRGDFDKEVKEKIKEGVKPSDFKKDKENKE